MRSTSLAVVLAILSNFFYEWEARNSSQFPLELPWASRNLDNPHTEYFGNLSNSFLLLLSPNFISMFYCISILYIKTSWTSGVDKPHCTKLVSENGLPRHNQKIRKKWGRLFYLPYQLPCPASGREKRHHWVELEKRETLPSIHRQRMLGPDPCVGALYSVI